MEAFVNATDLDMFGSGDDGLPGEKLGFERPSSDFLFSHFLGPKLGWPIRPTNK